MANDNAPLNPQTTPNQQNVPAGNHTPQAVPMEKSLIELQKREKELVKREAALKGAVPFESLKERAQKDRNGLLRELGLDDLITEDTNDPVVALRKEMEAMKAAAQKKEQDEIESRERQALKSKLHEKKDDIESVVALGYEDRVFEMLRNHDAEAGEPDPYSYAKQLEDAIYKDIEALKGTKRFSDFIKSVSSTQPRHPLDTNATINSSDRTQTSQTSPATPSSNRFQELQDLAKHLKFD